VVPPWRLAPESLADYLRLFDWLELVWRAATDSPQKLENPQAAIRNPA
jgi:hypothetical protein